LSSQTFSYRQPPREPLRLAPGARPRALGAARARRRREVPDPDRRQSAAPSRLRRFAAPIQLGAKIEPDRSWSNNAALTVGSLARDRNRHSRFPDAEQRRGHKMRLCRRQLRWEPEGTANKCLANGPAAYSPREPPTHAPRDLHPQPRNRPSDAGTTFGANPENSPEIAGVSTNRPGFARYPTRATKDQDQVVEILRLRSGKQRRSRGARHARRRCGVSFAPLRSLSTALWR